MGINMPQTALQTSRVDIGNMRLCGGLMFSQNEFVISQNDMGRFYASQGFI